MPRESVRRVIVCKKCARTWFAETVGHEGRIETLHRLHRKRCAGEQNLTQREIDRISQEILDKHWVNALKNAISLTEVTTSVRDIGDQIIDPNNPEASYFINE